MKKTIPHITLASQEKQKLIEPIQGLFLSKIFDIEGALITDESRISDFTLFPPEAALGKGKIEGTLIFKMRKYIGKDLINSSQEDRKNSNNWLEETIEIEPGMSKQEIIDKTKLVFGVDISPVYDQFLVDILLYIIEHFDSKPNGKQ